MDISNLNSILLILSSNNTPNEIFQRTALYHDMKCKPNFVSTFISNVSSLTGSFDFVLCIENNLLPTHLQKVYESLKPGSKFVIRKFQTDATNLNLPLRVAGYIVEENTEEFIVAMKPNYEVGSAVNIGFDGESTKKVWSLAADDMDDGDYINDEDLLDENDKAKPSVDELRVCASTKQRKACANCTCGLAEELEQEERDKIRQDSQNAKSSCGNCYLGDAFRCASCPYRGMPAFKPGEKVIIDTSDPSL